MTEADQYERARIFLDGVNVGRITASKGIMSPSITCSGAFSIVFQWHKSKCHNTVMCKTFVVHRGFLIIALLSFANKSQKIVLKRT